MIKHFDTRRRMEDYCLPRTSHPAAADIVCNHELTRSNSDASSLTGENCRDIFRRSENAAPVNRTTWTDEKHNLYLRRLEESFVKQLHQTKHLLAQCSEKNQRDTNVSQCLINVNNASKQFNVLQNGCWQKSDCVRGEPLASSTLADTHTSLKSKWLYNRKDMGVSPPPSADMPAFLELSSTVKNKKRIISHGLATCSKELSCNNPCHIDLNKEGTGQNFSSDDNRSSSNIESQAKRLKKAFADSSSQDQIVPSSGEEPTSHKCVEKFESFDCPST